MKSKEIRSHFLNFFKEKSHQIVASSPMVLKDDPTLMFTNSGMAPFKEYFLGNKNGCSGERYSSYHCSPIFKVFNFEIIELFFSYNFEKL